MDDYPMSIATRSTAARKDVQSGQASHVASLGSDRLIGTHTAGTQAPPVDTKDEPRPMTGFFAALTDEQKALALSFPEFPAKSKRGRPATGFDRKAYQAQKARERRAKGKAK
jgi:hypothetical protein